MIIVYDTQAHCTGVPQGRYFINRMLQLTDSAYGANRRIYFTVNKITSLRDVWAKSN